MSVDRAVGKPCKHIISFPESFISVPFTSSVLNNFILFLLLPCTSVTALFHIFYICTEWNLLFGNEVQWDQKFIYLKNLFIWKNYLFEKCFYLKNVFIWKMYLFKKCIYLFEKFIYLKNVFI